MSPCQVLGININDLQSNNLQWLKKKCVHNYKESNNFCILVFFYIYIYIDRHITSIINLVFHSNKMKKNTKKTRKKLTMNHTKIIKEINK